LGSIMARFFSSKTDAYSCRNTHGQLSKGKTRIDQKSGSKIEP
jgi:hypothetical protein